jgi:integrase
MTKNRSHSIPLSHQAISLLKGMMSISHNRVHVFPADGNPREHTHQQTVNMALKRMGFGGILVAHGMRALASTILSEQGFESDLIKAALANTDKNDVRMLDNQDEYMQSRKAMMSLWSIHIDNCAQLRYFKQS